MTVLTQALREKKLLSKQPNDIKQPLVSGEDSLPSAPQIDIESGSSGSLLSLRSRAQRVNNLTTLCVTLAALLVLTTGIVGGIILYRHFAQYRLRHFRGWCSIPYVDPNAQRYYGEDGLNHQNPMEAMTTKQMFDTINIQNMLNEMTKDIQENDDFIADRLRSINHNIDGHNYFNEEFDIDLEFEQYEQIEVPVFSNGRKGRFIHDFAKNKTGIIDIDSGRCFVMPLNRSQVLPPQSLYDLVVKMRTGYYEIDTITVRELYRVVTPPISDFKSVGYYIARECAKLPTYRLEKITSPVYKRSINSEPNVIFHEFAGVHINQIEIVNLIDANTKHDKH